MQNQHLETERSTGINKLENTEKYWINKLRGIEENYSNLKNQLDSSFKELESAKTNITILNQENERVSHCLINKS